MSLRKALDLTPWDKGGNSWMGLTRGQSKALAYFFMTVAVLMAIPPSGTPDDLLNIGLTKWLVSVFPDYSPIVLMALTYTLVPFLLFLFGIWVYPHNTESLFNGYVNKAQREIGKLLKQPLKLIIILAIGGFLAYIYFQAFII